MTQGGPVCRTPSRERIIHLQAKIQGRREGVPLWRSPTRWPSAKHFASWLGLSPNNRITGGRVISSRTKLSANRAAAAFHLAANALHRSDSSLGAFLRRKKAQLGFPKAITATAYELARIIYSMLRYGLGTI